MHTISRDSTRLGGDLNGVGARDAWPGVTSPDSVLFFAPIFESPLEVLTPTSLRAGLRLK
ncbi:hypothetical protein KSD_04710 [Ktedonobacter sp. SOSP1-85]|nr:hypothetical protein KSD_04710 [Ktedonobacter sp. SOSP1-85]